MRVVNETKSFLGVLLSDPSCKKFLVFLLVFIFWGFVLVYRSCLSIDRGSNFSIFFKNDASLKYFIIDGSILLLIYFILKSKTTGGTATKLLQNNKDNIKGKTVVITGGYKGIGLATAKVLLEYGCKIVLACRSMDYMLSVQKKLCQDIPGAHVYCVELDLGDLKTVESCANYLLKTFPKIDILINNAGALQKTVTYIDGLEYHFLVNYLGHFYLTKLLYDHIIKSDTLVVNLSSIAHSMLKLSDVNFNLVCEDKSRKIKNTFYLYRREYNISKLCMFYFTQTLQKRLENEKTNACAVAVNPGVVDTLLFRNEQYGFRSIVKKLFLKTPYQGCQTTLYVCLLDREKLAKGSYYSDCKTDVVTHYAKDEQKAEELWNLSEEILKKKVKIEDN